MTDKSLYLLLDGTYADPSECAKGTDGVLRHQNGVGVALNGDGEPTTMAVATETNAAAAGAAPGTEAPTEDAVHDEAQHTEAQHTEPAPAIDGDQQGQKVD